MCLTHLHMPLPSPLPPLQNGLNKGPLNQKTELMGNDKFSSEGQFSLSPLPLEEIVKKLNKF